MSKLTQAQFKRLQDIETEITEIQTILNVFNKHSSGYKVSITCNGANESKSIERHIGIEPFQKARQDIVDALDEKLASLKKEYSSYVAD